MSNNRMYLVCRGCNEKIFLGKTFRDSYIIEEYDEYEGVILTDRLNQFYQKHSYCGKGIHPENQFILGYEIAIDEGIIEV